MALCKEMTSHAGITTNYHRISNVSLQGTALKCEMDSYVSAEYRELESPADHQYFMFEITVEEEESMGIRQLAYTKIKELPEWEGAEDC